MVRVGTRLRLCFWLLGVFLAVQSAILVFYSRRSSRRAFEAVARVNALSDDVGSFSARLESDVSGMIDWVHEYLDARSVAGADVSASDAPRVTERVIGYGRNRKFIYRDVVISDGLGNERAERQYICRDPASMPAAEGGSVLPLALRELTEMSAKRESEGYRKGDDFFPLKKD